jgi:hypothetical protein
LAAFKSIATAVNVAKVRHTARTNFVNLFIVSSSQHGNLGFLKELAVVSEEVVQFFIDLNFNLVLDLDIDIELDGALWRGYRDSGGATPCPHCQQRYGETVSY